MQAPDVPPLVSVIIPAYNAERFLGETLRSVLSQTYTNLEVLVVDDGSQDGTTELVETACKEDSRIRLLRQPNLGVAAARNLAIERSSGALVAPLDADDIWFERKLEKQVDAFRRSDAAVGLVYAWSVLIDEAGRMIAAADQSRFEGDVYLDLVFSNFVGNSSAPLIRRECLERTGGYNCAFKASQAQGCEDWDLYLRIAEQFQFRLVPEYLVGYRTGIGTMSSDCVSMERSYRIISETVEERHPEIPPALLRWSKSKMYYFLLCKSCARGDASGALYWLLRSLQYDPLRLLSNRLYKALFACMLRLVNPEWSSSALWRRRIFRSRSTTGRTDETPPPTLYDRIRRRDLQRLRRRAPRFARAWAV